VAGGGVNGDGEIVGPYVIAVNRLANGQFEISQVADGDGNLVDDSITLDSAGTSDPDIACGDEVVAIAWQIQGQDIPNADQARRTITWADLNNVGIT
jgi:hypothetical protein